MWHRMKAANVVLYIPFEHLTADHSGPETLQKLAHLLQSVNVTVPDDDAIECLWKHLVKDAPKKREAKRTHRAGPCNKKPQWLKC